MSHDLPHFPDPRPLSGGRTWTAEFESWDPRTDNTYYWVTVRGADEKSFFVRVSKMGYADPAREQQHLRERVALVAETGESNTEYQGSVPWQMERGITS